MPIFLFNLPLVGWENFNLPPTHQSLNSTDRPANWLQILVVSTRWVDINNVLLKKVITNTICY